MRESRFIDQNLKNWKEFEEELAKSDKNPERLSQLYVQITDDLSYSRTYYPNRSVRYYLNNLSQSLYLWIYKYRNDKSHTVAKFWREELPSIFWHARKDLLISFLIFSLSIAAGYFSCVQDPDFVNQILGDGYVSMTQDNIAKGDPLAVYKDDDAFMMFLQITSNNVRVSLITFLFGLFVGVGSIGILIGNGVMVGAFHHLFFRYDLGTEAIITILQHGALELSAIVIAGAAGIQIGRGWFFPGTFSRSKSFRYAANRGFKIMLGVIPIIILAGVIESYITRLTDVNNVVRIGVIVISFGFILFYYVIFPWFISKEKRDEYEFERIEATRKAYKFELFNVKKAGELFTSTFFLARGVIPKIMGWFLIIALAESLVISFALNETIISPYGANPFSGLAYIAEFFHFSTSFDQLAIFLTNVIAFSAFSIVTYFYLLKELARHTQFQLQKIKWVPTIIFVLSLQVIFHSVFFIPGGVFKFLFFFVNTPIVLLALAVVFQEKKNSLSAVGKSLQLIGAGFGRFFLSYLAIFFICFIFFILYSAPVLWIFIDYVFKLLPIENIELLTHIKITAINLIVFMGLGVILSLCIINFALNYFNLIELSTAKGLKSKIENIGIKKRFYGLEREN